MSTSSDELHVIQYKLRKLLILALWSRNNNDNNTLHIGWIDCSRATRSISTGCVSSVYKQKSAAMLAAVTSTRSPLFQCGVLTLANGHLRQLRLKSSGFIFHKCLKCLGLFVQERLGFYFKL